MREECEECWNRFTLWVQWWTVQFEDGSEKMLCDYCKK